MNLLWWLVIYGAGPAVTPSTGGTTGEVGIGQKRTFSDQAILGGGGGLG